MKPRSRLLPLVFVCLAPLPAYALAHRLIVVEDRGGASALPYYRALNLLPDPSDLSQLPLPSVPAVSMKPYSEADFLPVHSVSLTPGPVRRRVIAAPGLKPLCLLGDDSLSRAWLKQRLPMLQALNAIGLVVEVASYRDLQALRHLAPGVPLVPASGDDLARRLDLNHYPVLVTPTGIEQ